MNIREKIGVIVPIYKTEEYVAECIESILAQTHTNFRLILVDDGSPDGAGAICDEYATKDKRITVIHQENAGVTRARARGVEEATDCEWITFVDSDDTIIPEALELLHKDCYNHDIIASSIDNTQETLKLNCIEWRKFIIEGKLCSPWAKLYRRSLFHKETFAIPREIIVGEDLLMNLILAFENVKDVYIIDKKIYKYRNNEESCLHQFKNTIEYENKFDTILKSIIDKSNNNSIYIHSFIKKRIILWDRLFGYSAKKPLWFGSEYHKTLLNDIHTRNYPIGIIEYQLLKTKNRLARFILINLRKTKNILTRIASKQN